MAQISLNLGAVLSELLKSTNSNFTELYDAISKIQEAIADDGEKAIVYSTVDKMVAGLNAGTDEAGKALEITIGDEIYILDDETPDFWVSAVNSTSTTGTKPASWEKGTNYTFGKYTIRVSKSREIDLADYQKIVNMETGDSLVDDSTKKKYPSSHTVYTWVNTIKTALEGSISTLNGKAHTHSNKSLLDTYTQTEANLKDAVDKKHSHSNKALLDTYDQTNVNIKDAVSKKHSHSNQSILDATTASYTTAEKEKLGNIDSSLEGVTADQIGKVKDVQVNGSSVLGTDGVANISITIEQLGAGFVSVSTTDSVWTAQKIGETTYQAIKVEKTDTALGVFNSSGQEIVVQKTYDANYLYLLVGTEKIACTIRKLSGGAVGTGSGGSSESVNSDTIQFTRYIMSLTGYDAEALGGYIAPPEGNFIEGLYYVGFSIKESTAEVNFYPNIFFTPFYWCTNSFGTASSDIVVEGNATSSTYTLTITRLTSSGKNYMKITVAKDGVAQTTGTLFFYVAKTSGISLS